MLLPPNHELSLSNKNSPHENENNICKSKKVIKQETLQNRLSLLKAELTQHDDRFTLKTELSQLFGRQHRMLSKHVRDWDGEKKHFQ